MRALVYDRPGRKYGSIREIDTPKCGDGQGLIEVISCGICKPAEKSHDQMALSLEDTRRCRDMNWKAGSLRPAGTSYLSGKG